jgi:hypothetical protein
LRRLRQLYKPKVSIFFGGFVFHQLNKNKRIPPAGGAMLPQALLLTDWKEIA